jgi:hypothetical protein
MSTSLADHLRSLPDDGLATLFELRPDLVVPVPADMSALAVRAQSRVSVARALDGLDQFTLEILDALRLSLGEDATTSVDAVLVLTANAADPTEVRRAVDRLRSLVIGYGPDHAIRIVVGVHEVCSPYPAGLGRPGAVLDPEVAALCADPARLRRTLLAAPPPARAVLDRLAAGPPVGTIATNGTVASQSENTVDWLVDNRLLARTSDGTVELPREVGLILRRDAGPLGPLHPRPPALTSAMHTEAAVDSAGTGQVMEAVRQAEAILEALAGEPTTLLRSGGLGVRDIRRIARTAGAAESTAALLCEVSYAAGLLGDADSADRAARRGATGFARPTGQLLLPTTAYDTWRTSPLAQRWATLARAWLAMTREPRLVGERDDRDRPVNVLAQEAARAGAPATRRAALEVLAALPPGSGPTPEEVLAELAWQAPRRSMGRTPAVEAALREAAQLGLTGLGGLTSYSRLLLAETQGAERDEDDPLGLRAPDDPAERRVTVALDALLPPPVDHVLVQADLTVVVPGPPEPALAAELALVAEHESAGGATVYRVTADSVRRAFDAGYAGSDLHALFRRRSRTPVPQALTYLIDDVARRHGGLRTGSAAAYLRSDDEPLLAELLVDRRLAVLSLRRLAPTVLVTRTALGRVLTLLREAGYAPVPEDASGAVVLTRPTALRATRGPSLRPAYDPIGGGRFTRPRLLGIAEQIRHGDAAARAARRAPITIPAGLVDGQAHTQALAILQQALREKARVWVGYVDSHGATAQRLVRPVSIGAGYLRAEDERTDMLHTFALHRITAAALAE